MPLITYRDALNQALREEMHKDDRVFLMGEEVGVYNGAYKVSKGLLEEFGEMRVVDTPITELGFAGVGVGAAMVGLRPVVEFMTWNFALLALDQVVNAAAKMLYMSGGQYNMPIVFRGPNGAALQLSAQHSQAWESWLAHIPGLKVVAPGTPYDAKGLLKSAIRDDNPVIVLEGEMLYNLKGEVPDEEYLIPLGKAELKREGDHCSHHHERQDGARRDAGRRHAREGRHQDRRRRPAHDPPDGRRRNHHERQEDESRRCARGRVGGVRHRLADRRLHPARLLRSSRLARHSRASGRHADAVREGAREVGEARSGQDDRGGEKSHVHRGLTMATKVFMEALSPTMEEGRLVKWLKNEGDAVKSGDVLAEVETDKAVMELAARGEGVLRKRLVNEGEAVPVGTLVGVIGGEG